MSNVTNNTENLWKYLPRPASQQILSYCDPKVRLVSKSFCADFDSACKGLIWNPSKFAKSPKGSEEAGLATFLHIFETAVLHYSNQTIDIKFFIINKELLKTLETNHNSKEKPCTECQNQKKLLSNGFMLLKRYFEATKYTKRIEAKEANAKAQYRTEVNFSDINNEILQAFRGSELLSLTAEGYLTLPKTSAELQDWLGKAENQCELAKIEKQTWNLPFGCGLAPQFILFKNLQILNLANNGLCTLPSPLAQLRLTTLELGNNSFTEIPACIFTISSLKNLNMSSNQISVLPEGMLNLTNLRELDLKNNCLKALPKWIEQLTKLDTLILSSNPFKKFPFEVTQLTNLVMLHLENNMIEMIPDEIGNLKKLEFLYLSRNAIQQLPDTFMNLTKLVKLHLEQNQLRSIKPLSRLQSLEGLYLQENQLTSEECQYVPKAREIFLHKNLMNCVEGFRDFTGTYILILDNNGITDISKLLELSSLKLEWLSIQDNQITCLGNPLKANQMGLHNIPLMRVSSLLLKYYSESPVVQQLVAECKKIAKSPIEVLYKTCLTLDYQGKEYFEQEIEGFKGLVDELIPEDQNRLFTIRAELGECPAEEDPKVWGKEHLFDKEDLFLLAVRGLRAQSRLRALYKACDTLDYQGEEHFEQKIERFKALVDELILEDQNRLFTLRAELGECPAKKDPKVWGKEHLFDKEDLFLLAVRKLAGRD